MWIYYLIKKIYETLYNNNYNNDNNNINFIIITAR